MPRTYEATVSAEELKRLQAAHRDGKFSHNLVVTATNGPWEASIEITTANPQQMCVDLQAVIDAGETTWNEIFNVDDDHC